jgi:hypothetical protein
MTSDADVQQVMDSELRLLTPAVRRSPAAVEALLHPEFVEFGASGRRWDRPAMVAAIGAGLTDGTVPEVSEVRGVRLAESVVLVTYVTRRPGQRVRRSSLWRRNAAGTWQLYFHQGTPTDG